ncbi:serine/threonine-protein kinase [Nannocystis pusilla]|uniref:Serine/threonine-protein kinase n=1 Tax=Nannocystis pusilla TaxID=889268 RepID=A0ABS7U3A8_9BACT|nr:serine/threonine-protein kinase [Nannocystis pusilla]MBZ5714919.1 serine/threonine-protein kinase [Nannocystis pusilla]
MSPVDSDDPANHPLGAPPRMLAGVEGRVVKALIRSKLFADDAQPVRIDRFVVLRLQGTGATGVVYAAYDERLDRKIAIKLLRSDHAHASAQERLLREARALARLSHPNVVAVHEVGTFDDRVFIAMEFVDGPTLADWLTQRPRGWREVRDIFVQAGRGLAAAHAAGLVHRDFKPANVLVGSDGRVRVLDFGLVHAGEATLPDATLEAPAAAQGDDSLTTTTRRCVGTPGYMAAEQFRGLPADARSDQFGFCASLYEGLYGVRPFATGDMKGLQEAVCAGAVDEAPRGRRVPRWLRRVLLRGLSPAPEARWPSMDALLAQLERRPWQWIRAGLLALAAVVVVALWRSPAVGACDESGDAFVDVWGPAQQQRIAAAFRASGTGYADDAWLAVRRSTDDYTRQWRDMRRAACEETMLTHAQSPATMNLRMACLDRRRAELAALLRLWAREPVAPASQVQRATTAVAELQPLALCEDVEALRRGFEPPPPPLAASVARLREQLLAAHALEVAGDYRAARAAAAAAVTAARALAYPPVVAEALYQRGRSEAALDDGPAAAATLEEAAEAAEAAGHDALKAQAWALLIRVTALANDDPARAHGWYRLARAAAERSGDRGALRAEALEGEGLALFAESRFEAALAVQREVLALRERVLGPRHLKLARTFIHLANTLDAQGDKPAALELYERAAALQTEHLGPRHPEVAVSLFDLALVAIDLGALARAEEVLAQVRSIDLEAHGERSQRAAQIDLATAALREQQGAFAEALAAADAAVTVLAALVPGHREYATALATRGTLLFRLGRAGEALTDYQRACALWQRSADAEGAAMCASDEGEALLALGQADAALARFSASRAGLADIHPDDHELLAYPLHGEGAALLALGRAEEAVPPLRRALHIRSRGPADPLERAETTWALARALAALDAVAEAAALGREAHATFTALGSRGDLRRAELERWPLLAGGPR